MKIIRSFLATWLGWICLIIVLRFIFFLSTISIYSDKDFITNSLISKSLETKDRDLNDLTVEVLYKLAKIFPEQREKIKRKISRIKSSKELKSLLVSIDNDPEIILKETLKELNSFKPVNLINSILFVHLILAFLIVICLPLLGAFFFGSNSIKKIFGRHGPKILLGFNILLLLALAYLWFLHHNKLITQIILFFSSCIITLQLIKSKIITVLIGIDDKYVKKTGGIVFLVLLLSFLPYFYNHKSKFSEKRLKTAIDKVIKNGRSKLVPALLKILQYRHKFSKELTAKIIIAIGKKGKKEDIIYLSHLLHEKNKYIQKIALQAIKNILDRDINKN